MDSSLINTIQFFTYVGCTEYNSDHANWLLLLMANGATVTTQQLLINIVGGLELTFEQ